MATNILTNINLNQNEIQNAVIQNLAVAPSDPKDGQMYFDTVSKKVKTWNGTKWIDGSSDVYKFSADNPALTGSGNVCEWTVTHNLGNKYPVVQVYEAASGEMVLADIEAVSTTALKIKINAESVEEGTYKAVIMG